MYNPADILLCLTPQAMRTGKIPTTGISLKTHDPCLPFLSKQGEYSPPSIFSHCFSPACAIDSFYLTWSSWTNGAIADLKHESSATHFTQLELELKILFQNKQIAQRYNDACSPIRKDNIFWVRKIQEESMKSEYAIFMQILSCCF